MTEQPAGAGAVRPIDDHAAWRPPGAELPPYPVAAPRRRRGPAVLGAAVAAAAVLAAGAFAVTSFGNDRPADPEAAVEALFAAVEDGDVLGILDSFTPGERAAVQPFVEGMVDELQRLEVLADDLELRSVDGFDFAVEDLALSSRPLADGIAVVTIEGGTLRSTVRPAEVPLGPLVQGFLEEGANGLDEATTTTDLVGAEPVQLVVVDDEGWHISLGYTVAEQARIEAGAPLPDFAAGLTPAGASSPEGALEALLDAVAGLDVERLLTLLPPGEMSAVHDYAPLFLPAAQASVADLRTTSDFSLAIDRLDTEVDADGGTATVRITGFDMSGQVDGEPVRASFDGECFAFDGGGTAGEQCLGDLEGTDGDAGLRSQLAATQLTVYTVEVDGEWYVSPTRTALEQGLALLRVLQPEDLQDPEALLTRLVGVNPFLFAPGLAVPGATGGTGEDGSGMDAGWDPDEDGALTEAEPKAAEDGGFAACAAIYEELPDSATDEAWAEADVAFDECLTAAAAD